jgi:hypothetical protein
MDPITIPLLYCPFTPAINPLASEAARHSDAWVQAFNLHEGASFHKYQQDNFAWLTARFYPGARLEQLKIANDFVVLLFAIDDLLDHQLDKAPLVQQKENFQYFIEQFTRIVNGEAADSSGDDMPVIAAMADLWPRIARISPPGWIDGLADSISALLKAAIWEYENVRSTLPTVAQYLERRPFLAGAHISAGIIPIIEEIWLPEEVMQDPVVKALEGLSRNLVCWSNDLFSFSKEQGHGDEHNLVSVLQHERKLTLEEAIVCAAAIHNTDMRQFITLSSQLPVYDEKTNRALERYVEAHRRHIRGNVDWSERDSKRYSFVYGNV